MDDPISRKIGWKKYDWENAPVYKPNPNILKIEEVEIVGKGTGIWIAIKLVDGSGEEFTAFTMGGIIEDLEKLIKSARIEGMN